MGATFFSFWNFESPFWTKNICKLWSWNLQNMFELSFFFCISKKSVKFQYLELLLHNLNLHLFSRKIAIFRFRHALYGVITAWRLAWSNVFWYVWIEEIKPNYWYQNQVHMRFGCENLGRGCNNPLPWLDEFNKIAWLDEG